MKFDATILFLSLVMIASPSLAKLRLITLEDMIRGADIIALGDLEKDSQIRAVFRTRQTLKGESTKEIQFDLSRRSACQVPIAKGPEEVILFITRNDEGTYRIYATGRGCMPIDKIDENKYTAFHSMVSSPYSIERIDCPSERSGYKQSISLADLLGYIEKIKAKGRVKKKLKIPSQSLQPTVKTPVESGNEQGTAGHE